MNLRFIKSSEKKKIISQLKNQFGIEELPYLLIESGKEKIRGYSGHFSKDEILKLSEMLNIESIGLYLIRREHDFRLGFDATQLLANQLKNKIININEEQSKIWLKGLDIPIQSKLRGTVLIRYNNDFLGCGKSTGIAILNHVPKERRLRK